jgi:hypothetical protein
MKSLTPWIILILVIAIFIGCKKDDKISTNSSDMLSFSADTIIFDTVFTTIGSTTRLLKVYNDNDETVSISNINIEGGDASNFRINVDGDPGTIFQDVQIGADDSLFIFVEVTVDVNNQTGPMVIEEHLNFTLNGNEQEVLLVAWGQDAHFHYPTSFLGSLGISCLDEDGDCFNGEGPVEELWVNDKPHVVYGYLIVDSLDHLTIEAGTQVHFHDGSGLWVWRGGCITVNGEPNDRVVFQGDRLDFVYDDVPGQWDLIRINDGPSGLDNVFNYATIKNSIVGIQATPVPILQSTSQANSVQTSENWLVLNGVIMKDNSDIGLFSRNTKVRATNSVFANAGRFSGLLQGGGVYEFDHCTFANYWTETTRNDPGFFISNRYPNELNSDVTILYSIAGSFFRNCIMYGNNFEEFAYDFDTSSSEITVVPGIFENNLYKVNETNINNLFFIGDNWTNNDPDFFDISLRNYTLSAGSFAIDKASVSST